MRTGRAGKPRAQLVVLMVGTTAQQDIDDYSLAVAEANKVGRKGVDDGVFLRLQKNDRQVRRSGYPGCVPDAACARIIREYIAPKFRSNDYWRYQRRRRCVDSADRRRGVAGASARPGEERRGLGLQNGLFIGVFVVLFRAPARSRGVDSCAAAPCLRRPAVAAGFDGCRHFRRTDWRRTDAVAWRWGRSIGGGWLR